MNLTVPKLRFPKFIDSWKEKKLGDITTFLDEKRVPLKAYDREQREGYFPYYGASGIIDYVDDYIFDEELICLEKMVRTSSVETQNWFF